MKDYVMFQLGVTSPPYIKHAWWEPNFQCNHKQPPTLPLKVQTAARQQPGSLEKANIHACEDDLTGVTHTLLSRCKNKMEVILPLWGIKEKALLRGCCDCHPGLSNRRHQGEVTRHLLTVTAQETHSNVDGGGGGERAPQAVSLAAVGSSETQIFYPGTKRLWKVN